MMRKILIAFVSTLVLVGCGGTDSPEPEEPYVAAPLADLEPGTELAVRGNHTGWWRDRRNPTGTDVANETGPKLQRLDTTANANEYVAVFRNNNTGSEFYYGSATFLMPAGNVAITGTTDEGYEFRIIRINDNLIYTLTGLFDIHTNPGLDAGREAHGGFVAGSDTPVGDLPTTGSRTYQGDFIGRSNQLGEVTGSAELTANWGTGDISGSITDIAGISDFSIDATITPTGYEGIITSDGTGAFTASTDGRIEGGFYGPNGEETGATIRIEEGGHWLTGSLGGMCTANCP